MDDKLTEIIVVADRSGSMNDVRDDTIGGFNAFLKEQQKLKDGRCLLTYCQFDTEYEVVHESLPIEKMKPLDYSTFEPRGATALLDAVGKTIDEAGARFAAMPEDKRPGNVVLVIMTDGQENSSGIMMEGPDKTPVRKYTLETVKERITHQADKYDWSVIFLGQNIDAFAAGDGIGVTNQHSNMFVGNVGQGGLGMQRAFVAMSAAVGSTRSKKARGLSKGYTTGERAAYTSALDGDEDALNDLNSPPVVTSSSDSSSGDSL